MDFNFIRPSMFQSLTFDRRRAAVRLRAMSSFLREGTDSTEESYFCCCITSLRRRPRTCRCSQRRTQGRCRHREGGPREGDRCGERRPAILGFVQIAETWR